MKGKRRQPLRPRCKAILCRRVRSCRTRNDVFERSAPGSLSERDHRLDSASFSLVRYDGGFDHRGHLARKALANGRFGSQLGSVCLKKYRRRSCGGRSPNRVGRPQLVKSRTGCGRELQLRRRDHPSMASRYLSSTSRGTSPEPTAR